MNRRTNFEARGILGMRTQKTTLPGGPAEVSAMRKREEPRGL
jgi:hypothetical protein